MRPLKTISFFEGENGMRVDVAGQQLTGTRTGHPFLHRVSAEVTDLSDGRLPSKYSQVGSSSDKTQSFTVRDGRFAGHAESGRWSQEVSKGQPKSTISRPNTGHGEG